MENDSSTMRPNAVDSTKSTSLAQQALGNGQQQRLDAGNDGVATSVAAKSDIAADAVAGWMDGVKVHIRDNPLTAVGIVAAIAYLLGATR